MMFHLRDELPKIEKKCRIKETTDMFKRNVKGKLTGPDHPIHVPMIRPPKTAENAANS